MAGRRRAAHLARLPRGEPAPVRAAGPPAPARRRPVARRLRDPGAAVRGGRPAAPYERAGLVHAVLAQPPLARGGTAGAGWHGPQAELPERRSRHLRGADPRGLRRARLRGPRPRRGGPAPGLRPPQPRPDRRAPPHQRRHPRAPRQRLTGDSSVGAAASGGTSGARGGRRTYALQMRIIVVLRLWGTNVS